jgi:biopolymer transport protein ExbD
MIRRSTDDRGNGLYELAADLTPMLDVLFILLVFFVLTANSAQLVLDVTLPKDQATAAKPLPQPERIVIAILPDEGKWQVKDSKLETWEETEAAIKAAIEAAPKAAVVIASDQSVPMQRFVQTLSYLRNLGVAKVDIAMEPR